MKLTKQGLMETLKQKESECSALFLALNDLAHKKVKWFRVGSAKLGICRCKDACGGVVIHDGSYVSAYYFETWFIGIREFVPSESNKEGMDLRNCAFQVQAHIQNEVKQ